VLASPSVLGVDFLQDPAAADDPLTSLLPISTNTLHLFGIVRCSWVATVEDLESVRGAPIDMIAAVEKGAVANV